MGSNSKVFFRKINASRVKQRVYQIKREGGELLTAQNEVNQEFISYFQNLFGGPSLNRSLDLEFLRPELKHTISPAEACLLTAPVTRSEVKDAIFDIDVESAPGPDGYTSEFYRAAWSVLGQDLYRLLVNMPLYVSDYRPISCCNVLYKAITKIMVKRIHRILPLMIDNSQNAFVPGRSITDNILLAQELLAGYNQMRLPNRCTLKVDIQKAYDSVKWDFLLEVLSFFFSINQWFDTWFFQRRPGLRQGDPMSPYLFVLVMEIGNALLKHRVKQATEFQYHWKCKDLGLINLCFADDVLLFCKAHLPSIKVLTDTLTEFAAMSGLKINPAKSQIILSRSVQQERQQILDYLGFQEGTLPIKYLGIPLTSSRLTMSDCRPLIDKVEARLAGWNHQNLSYAGRLQLIKSVLGTLHMYWASAFILPKGVLKILEKKMRRFLWHGSGNAKVAWAQICKPKQEGGLGIRSLVITNQALMLKQLWRLLQNDGTSIWVEWIQRHRLRQSTIWTFNGATGSWGWKKLLKLRPLLQRGVIYKVGDGSSFSLWQDVWHERGPLCLTFPRGPVITGLPLSSPLSSVLQRNQWSWPASTDADIAEIISQLPPTQPSAADSICWRSSSGKFTTKSAVSLIQPTSSRIFWEGLLNGKFKIPKHTFILWMAMLEKLSTMDKPWVPRADDGCVLCGGLFDETHDHLFFHCWYSKRCLAILKSKVRFQWPYLEWQRGLNWASKKWRGNHLVNAAFRATLAALVYHLWVERNNRKFAATSSSAESTTSKVLEDVRMRIMVAECSTSLQSQNLYRIWNLA
ncbi:UNVERIFIED_CONTAM: hypothetical protein Sangu_3204200 [Sesamum angustifolium]|uniref:Reverse transcriptase domain-containing protein n=1 Tax=Sesamum angustifolium TaxID=2727405 RepID=A0AAW2JLB3_9LAMI